MLLKRQEAVLQRILSLDICALTLRWQAIGNVRAAGVVARLSPFEHGFASCVRSADAEYFYSYGHSANIGYFAGWDFAARVEIG